MAVSFIYTSHPATAAGAAASSKTDSSAGPAGQNTPRWIRHAAISPDGGTIAFAWQGDIFTVPSKGGKAVQLTSNDAYESDPLWSADGRTIVFSSYREESRDVWKVAAEGGTPMRLTTYSGAETPLAVSADGYVYFIADIQTDASYSGFPGKGQTYKVSLEGGNPVQVLPFPVGNISISPDGATILYEDIKGVEDALRKHHTSSVTRDVWKWNVAARRFEKLSQFKGENRNPVFDASRPGNFFYLSERDGNFNVYAASFASPSDVEKVTSLPTHPVRNLSAASDGTIAFSYNGDLYTCRVGEQPRKVVISLLKDKKDRDVVHRSALGGIRSFAVSRDGKEAAVISRGDIYVTLADQDLTHRLTSTPEQERGVSFSKDGHTIYYASERNGYWGIYKSQLKDKKDKYFSLSYEYEESLFTKEGENCFQPKVSPDGKWVAFLRDRSELVIRSTSGGTERSLLKGVNYSYQDGDIEFEWSPDSQYLLSTYDADGGWNNSDIAVVSIDGKTVKNLTRSGYSDNNFRWAMDGHAMTWNSDRAGYRSHGSWGAESDVYIMFFDDETFTKWKRSKDEQEILDLAAGKKKKESKKDKEKADSTAADKEVKPLKLDFDGVEDRTVRLTTGSGRMRDHFLTKDGKKIYYTVKLEKSYDLVCRSLEDGSIKVVQRNVKGSFTPSADGKYMYMTGTASITKIDASTGKSSGSISFRGEYDYRADKEREYIFDHCWNLVNEKFYDAAIHGIPWKSFHDNYAQFLPYINNNFDFRELLSEMLGELNGSHTGARYSHWAGLFYTPAGHVGVLYAGPAGKKGLEVAEILPGSVLKAAFPALEKGDAIVSVNGKKIEEGSIWYDAFAYTAGKRVELQLRHGGKNEKVFLKTTGNDRDGLYLRWVRRNEELVSKLSGGRVGYVHVQKMNSDSFREVYSKALGKYRNCEALIVDTRHNGGGWLHDDLASFLNGRAYIEFRPRGQYIGTEPYSKWNKPSCVLMGEDNYSDACGFPYVYKTLGIGKLIGAPVPGTMTAVWWETQIDPSLVFGVPQVTSWGLKEDRPLENLEIEPDILVYNSPQAQIEGRDEQIEAAVAEMLKTIEKK